MKNRREKFIEAADFVCGECYFRSESRCEKCAVRMTIDKMNK